MLAVLVAALATPGIADASCTSASANGNWDFYNVYGGSYDMSWTRCWGGIINNGFVTATCTSNDGQSSTVIGLLYIASTCRVTGNLTQTFANGFTLTDKITQATLTAGNTIISGVGKSNDGQLFQFQGTHR
jgi:hypothetical protein